MPAISVIVPMYDVAPYVEACLRSLGAQTARDFEVIVIDDGSTDGSRAIAERVAADDRRFRVVHQANQGLGRARNAGLEQADCELVAFADSDDVLPADALARLEGSLRRTGSDFATGKVHRYDGRAGRPAPFLRKAFLRNRPRTHVTRFPWLVSDRVAWNKLWRRAFLDAHGLRFSEGVYHEDIPMVVPAHYLARAVDVVAHPVYLWRERAESITQRRTEVRMLRDRLAAVTQVCDFLDATQAPAARRVYHESVLAEDLRYHLDVLDVAGDDYRAAFFAGAAAFLERVGPGIEDGLPPIQRLKWHLVRRGALPELLEVLRFERERLGARPRVRRAGRLYGDYPYLDDPALGIPRSVYRLDTGRRRLRQAVILARPARVPRR
jgi:CDP-glycerol glycerophosphotransferase